MIRHRVFTAWSCESRICWSGGDEVGAGDGRLLAAAHAGAPSTVPAVGSSVPTITATAAPLRSAAFICAFMLRLLVGAVGADAGARAARAVSTSASRPPVVSTTNTSTPVGGRREDALVVAGEQRAVDAEREADARRRRAAERLDEPVVAAAATERVLGRVERAALELERGVAVVVEPADELQVDRERDAERGRARRCTVAKWAAAASDQNWSIVGADAIDRRVLAALGVEHPQRVLARACSRLCSRQRVAGRLEVRAERLDVAGAVGGLAERVDEQRAPAAGRAGGRTPSRARSPRRRGTGRRRRAPRCRPGRTGGSGRAGASRSGSCEPEYQTFHGVSGPVLDERPAHAGRELGAQRDVPAALVDEVVHLLRHDVGGLADAGEDPEVLHHRRDDLAGSRPPRRPSAKTCVNAASEPTRARGCRASRGSSGTQARPARLSTEHVSGEAAVSRSRAGAPPGRIRNAS